MVKEIKIDVEGLMKSLLQRRPMKARFKLPLSEDEAYAYLLAAMKAEVTYRHRRFCTNEDLEEQISEMAHWLTSPSSKFGMLLCGGCGNGKSTMLKAFQQLLNYLHIPKPYSDGTYGIQIVDAKYIAHLCKNNFEAYRKLMSVDMLGIDDLGTEPSEVMNYGNVYTPVIDLLTKRYEDQLFTITTTNLTPQQIREHYNDRDYAYMIWGVDDGTHEIIGTKVHLQLEKKGEQELENWLRYLLSKNADFEFYGADIDGKHVELIRIHKALNEPVAFQKIDYIRSGSYTKKLHEFPVFRAQLWDKLRHAQFEDVCVKTDQRYEDIIRLLQVDAYFTLLKIPQPVEKEAIVHYLNEDGIIQKQDNGLYSITNLGALLFAKDLNEFARLGRKAMRVVQYKGINRLLIQKEESFIQGYAICFENIVRYVNALLPSNEDVNAVQLSTTSKFPLPSVREAIANSLIHQDLYITGAAPVVEIFDNRIEVTNPGTPLVDVLRIIDNPPKSRNEKLASLMRRLKMCEELGRGWDRMVLACEAQFLPAPRIEVFQDSTKVTLFSEMEFSNIPMEDKLWSCYLHACLMYIQGDALTNKSLRDRFGIPETSSSSSSRLIREAIRKNLIKVLDPNTAPRYMRYIPIWA